MLGHFARLRCAHRAADAALHRPPASVPPPDGRPAARRRGPEGPRRRFADSAAGRVHAESLRLAALVWEVSRHGGEARRHATEVLTSVARLHRRDGGVRSRLEVSDGPTGLELGALREKRDSTCRPVARVAYGGGCVRREHGQGGPRGHRGQRRRRRAPGGGGAVRGWVEPSVADDGTTTYERSPTATAFGHGTACAGIIHSIAPDAEMYSVRCSAAPQRKGPVFAAGVRWAAENGMQW